MVAQTEDLATENHTMETCKSCESTDDPTTENGICLTCFNRLTTYLKWKPCFPDDLSLADMFDRMFLIDKAMKARDIPEEERSLLCRNMGVYIKDNFPDNFEAVMELLDNAIYLKMVQVTLGCFPGPEKPPRYLNLDQWSV